MFGKLREKIHRVEEEDPFETESRKVALEAVTLFAAQPPELQQPIVEYNARFNPYEHPISDSSYFDIKTLKPGAILRLNLGGYVQIHPISGEQKQGDEIYEYLVCGKQDSSGRLRIYEVGIPNNDKDIWFDPCNPNLALTEVGFELSSLDYMVDVSPYRGTQFPIALAKDFFRLGDKRWHQDLITGTPGSLNDPFHPDPYLTNRIDIMSAGEKSCEPQSEATQRTSRRSIQTLIPSPVGNS